MNIPILSIKPQYTKQIYLGNKTVELRKKIGKKFSIGQPLFIYSSAPHQYISGMATIQNIEYAPIDLIGKLYLKQACIDKQSFYQYYQDKIEGVLIWLTKIKEFEQPISLRQLKTMGFNPPQSFCYAHDELAEFLTNFTKSALINHK